MRIKVMQLGKGGESYGQSRRNVDLSDIRWSDQNRCII